MSFRQDSRRLRAWQKWLDQHRSTLISCSLPEFLFSDEARWFRFVEHDGWDQESGWNIEMLSPDQAAALYDLITSEPNCAEFSLLLGRVKRLHR